MSERWVQHKSGQGEKWKVAENYKSKSSWCVYAEGETEYYHYLPQSEYIECDPPEMWVECTREVCSIDSIDGETHLTMKTVIEGGYTARSIHAPAPGERWAWRGDALVIERKK